MVIVTTCVVVWIEIVQTISIILLYLVTTCVVVWIEICCTNRDCSTRNSHHLRGGVD